ncbi:HD domain-containing protein [Amycolatopsis umgeniensis]|uniref:HD superfamily phosphodiesterase n=1 Tax=Amycolatopsis umgeniensis TaxID=336628 RepID=A0A841B7Z9_9PSEU|nr:HD domain-containing protein [Amycolatopsis umgeniensis]MBB5854935.1 HD superfamily phosphodiesterase [Amycolatopsis umgeniensis]
MSSPALRRALTDPGEPPLRPLPEEVGGLLEKLAAPPRLAAHLRAVHDVACTLADWLEKRHPEVVFDREVTLFGAAVHDVGKTIHREELSGPGSAHEQAGYELLVSQGIDEDRARFARTHAAWGADVGVEDLLVSVADKVWKAKRVTDLEQALVDRLAAATGQPPWEVFMALDDALERIAAEADGRLAFQASHPVGD